MSVRNIIIGLLLIGLGFALALWWKPKPETIVVTRIDTIQGDTVPYVVEVKKPVPVYIDTGSTRWRELPIDTMAILKDYFAKAIYLDTLKNDTSALVVVLDTVTQNRLQNRRLIFANRRPIAIIHTTTNNYPDEKFKIYLGGSVMTSSGFSEIGIGGKIQTGNWLFGYDYGVLHNSHNFGIYYNFVGRKKFPP